VTSMVAGYPRSAGPARASSPNGVNVLVMR
jgi:hypothetical protein